MRFLQAVLLCIFLGGCYASTQEVRAKLGDEYIGKSLDTLVLPKAAVCKISVIASPAGMVTRLTTEDSSVVGREAVAGIDFYGSVCANHLGIRRQG